MGAETSSVERAEEYLGARRCQSPPNDGEVALQLSEPRFMVDKIIIHNISI